MRIENRKMNKGRRERERESLWEVAVEFSNNVVHLNYWEDLSSMHTNTF